MAKKRKSLSVSVEEGIDEAEVLKNLDKVNETVDPSRARKGSPSTEAQVKGKIITVNLPEDMIQLLEDCALQIKREEGGRMSLSRAIRVLVDNNKDSINAFISGDSRALGDLNK